MTAKRWVTLLKKQTKGIGTYRKEFDQVIKDAANILEQRDAVYTQYMEEGAHPVIKKTSDRGAENTAKNPLLSTWEDLNKTALSFYRDLGLTPAGLKRLTAVVVEDKDGGGLAALLENISV